MEIKKQFHYLSGTFGPPKVGKTTIVNQLIHKNLRNATSPLLKMILNTLPHMVIAHVYAYLLTHVVVMTFQL